MAERASEALYDAQEYLVAGPANHAEWWEHLGDAHRDYAALAQAATDLAARVEALLAERDALSDNAARHWLALQDDRDKWKGRVAVLEAALRDECEMNEQSLATLRDLLAHWERRERQMASLSSKRSCAA